MNEYRNERATPTLRTALAVLAVLALVVVTGCVGGGNADVGRTIDVDAEPAESNVTGDEVLESALESAEDAETYRVESETHMDLSSLFGLSISTNTTGEFDRENDAAHAQTEGEAGVDLVGFSGGEEFETTVYQASGTRYKRISNDSTNGDWEMSETDEPLSPGLDSLTRTVEDANATVEGIGTVEGSEAYVLSLDVSVNALGEDFGRNLGTHGNDEFGDEGGGNASEGNVETAETYLWVDRDTDRPLRFAYLVSLGFEGDGENEVGGEMEFFGDTRYAGYGEEVEIEMPEETDV